MVLTMSLTSAPSVLENRGTRWLGAIGRLKLGVSSNAAIAHYAIKNKLVE